MEYEYEDFSVIVPNYLLDSNDNFDNFSIQEYEDGNEPSFIQEYGENDVPSGFSNVLLSDNDYTAILENIDSNLSSLSVQVSDIRDNTYRLYYFIGGMYVAFAIVLAIKILKQFF